MSVNFSIVVFISGTGSNLKSILEKQTVHDYKVSLVISNNIHAKGLEHAKAYDVPFFTFPWDKNDIDLTIVQNKINSVNCQLIVLAGFMKIMPAGFINNNINKIINIHPSLLPKYSGLHTHQRVLDSHDKFHGATVHYVNTELDAGEIISQTRFKVPQNSNAQSLATQLLFKEHSLLPHTIALIRQNRVKWLANDLYFDENILTQPIVMND